jgi:signal transduction histidine kinase
VPASLPQDVTLCIFRIAQEALCNCIKHSGAQSVEVLLEKINNEIHLSVSDDGRGFDQESERSKKGLGFISMRERLRLVDGCIHIHTRPNQGTRVEVSVPMTREADRGDLKKCCWREGDSWHDIQANQPPPSDSDGQWRIYETRTCCTR